MRQAGRRCSDCLLQNGLVNGIGWENPGLEPNPSLDSLSSDLGWDNSREGRVVWGWRSRPSTEDSCTEKEWH